MTENALLVSIISKQKKTSVRMYGGVGIMPGQIVGYSNGNLYFGVNDSYQIKKTDLNGKIKINFSLDRKRDKIPEKKEKHFLEKF